MNMTSCWPSYHSCSDYIRMNVQYTGPWNVSQHCFLPESKLKTPFSLYNQTPTIHCANVSFVDDCQFIKSCTENALGKQYSFTCIINMHIEMYAYVNGIVHFLIYIFHFPNMLLLHNTHAIKGSLNWTGKNYVMTDNPYTALYL